MSDSQPVASVGTSASKATAVEVSAEAGGLASASPASVVEANAPMKTNDGSSVERLAHTDNVPESWLWLNKLDQKLIAVFVAVFLMLSGYHWATLGGWGMRPIELERLPARQYDFRIDINSASWVEWTQIEGIGEVTAQKIIDDRQANGPFRSVKDLLRVKGIGPKTLEKMRPFLREPNEKSEPARAVP